MKICGGVFGMDKIFFVNIWVTLNCNFRCRYCYEKDKYENKELNYDTADSIINFIKCKIKKKQKLYINFHGGEPTLNFDIIKYIVLNVNKSITNITDFAITTNGSLLDADIIEFLCKYFKKNISISIDGKKETHDLNRKCINGEIDFETILNNALKLKSYNINVRIRMTYDRKNIYCLFENIKFFIEKGFKIIDPIPDYYSKKWKEEDFQGIKLEFCKLKEYLEKNKIVDIEIFELSNSFHVLGECQGGQNHFSIDIDGSIYPCVIVNGMSQFKMGDVFKGIEEEKNKKLEEINHRVVEKCIKCSLVNYCNSTRCKLLNYVTEKDFKNPNLVECYRMNIRLDLLSYNV